MSLKEASNKMSKSSKSDFTRINLLDAPDLLYKKIMKSKTDSIPEVAYDEARPELANLIRIYSEFKGISIEKIMENSDWGNILDFKKELYEVVLAELKPIRESALELIDSSELQKSLELSTEKARSIASETLKEVKNLIGLH